MQVTHKTQLQALISAIHPLTNDDFDLFCSIWVESQARRKELLTAAGETEKYLYFIVEGIQRVYYLDDQDREATLVFTYAPSFGGVLDSLMLQQPSRYYYETLSASVFLKAPQRELFRLMEQNRSIESLIRKGITVATSGLLERLAEVQCFSAEDRFRKLLARSPHILQLIPHKYLASYLAMDATNFSKLINKVRI